MSHDRYGILDEDALHLRAPRPVDDTAPTLDEAMALALDEVRRGVSRVTVCTVRVGKDGIPVERVSLLTLEAHEGFAGLDEDEEVAT